MSKSKHMAVLETLMANPNADEATRLGAAKKLSAIMERRNRRRRQRREEKKQELVSDAADVGGSVRWVQMHPDDRRAWRTVWAIETVRDGHVGNLADWGGQPTKTELEHARRILAGELKPVSWSLIDCHDVRHVFDSLEAARAFVCPKASDPYCTHFLHEHFPE